MFTHIGFLLSFLCMDSFLFCLFVWLKPTVPWLSYMLLWSFCLQQHRYFLSLPCQSRVKSEEKTEILSCGDGRGEATFKHGVYPNTNCINNSRFVLIQSAYHFSIEDLSAFISCLKPSGASQFNCMQDFRFCHQNVNI